MNIFEIGELLTTNKIIEYTGPYKKKYIRIEHISAIAHPQLFSGGFLSIKKRLKKKDENRVLSGY